jgi:hypothetical protein
MSPRLSVSRHARAQVLPAHDLAEGLENRLVAVVPRPQQLVLVEEAELHA